MSSVGKNLERFRIAVAAHDRENPTHRTHGIGMAYFDLERLGFDDGETLWPGITVEADGGQTGNFRILCDGNHVGVSDSVNAVSKEPLRVA